MVGPIEPAVPARGLPRFIARCLGDPASNAGEDFRSFMPEPAPTTIDDSLAKIRERFFADGDSLVNVRATSALTDGVVTRCFDGTFVDAARSGVTLVAVGGYGRAQLFPHSDVDLLLLVERPGQTDSYEDQISALLTELWDADLRVSHSVRSPAECARVAADNAELNISLLDTRFLAGDQSLYEDLRYRRLPRFYLREQRTLLKNLVELAHQRHLLAGQTIYHLEPDVKEYPGGLRDFQLACWISQLTHMSAVRLPESEECLPTENAEVLAEAKRFLFSVRSYLHYFKGRDNNKLDFERQDEVAGAGKAFPVAQSTSQWMRDYFRNVRVIYRLAMRMIEENATQGQSLFTFFRDRKSRLSNNDFVVRRGRVYPRGSQALATQPELTLPLFAFVSRHGVPLAVETEKRVERALEVFTAYAREGRHLWPVVAEILSLPFAYEALTAMHETGALMALFPELENIDCLVVRDFYHRFTVDEHTFVTIQTLHDLGSAEDQLTQRYQRLAAELDRPELLHFALLFHDVGKGAPQNGGHSERGLELADSAMERIQMEEEDRDSVRFLIRHHLVMSATMSGRDLSAPETIEQTAALAGTTERLKALTLMTFADISAVNPRAMTDWRKELLWQLYITTDRALGRDVEEHRIRVDASEALMEQASDDERDALREFLEGFPQRYLRTHGTEQILEQFRLSRTLDKKSAAASLTRRNSLYEVVVIARDRPFLFASLCATFSGFGLNIEKAEAFANESGLILDTFVVSDPGRSLELNPGEATQVKKALLETAKGTADLDELSARRTPFGGKRRPGFEPIVSYDNETSPNATLFHVNAEDRTGLLFDLAAKFSQHECNIEVVLIDTQGHRALDVFYLVGPDGAKLPVEACERLKTELVEAVSSNSV